MYLRQSKVHKDGKTHTCWRLVRSVRLGRRGREVMQETVAQLGERDAADRARAHRLACRVTGRGQQQELFEERPTEETVPVRSDRVRVERTRSFGDVYLGWTLWRGLGLDRFWGELMPEGREGVSWATMAEILVLARLCEPSSELHIAESRYSRMALDDLLGVREDLVRDDRLYRALDRLLSAWTPVQTFSLWTSLRRTRPTSVFFLSSATVGPSSSSRGLRSGRRWTRQLLHFAALGAGAGRNPGSTQRPEKSMPSRAH